MKYRFFLIALFFTVCLQAQKFGFITGAAYNTQVKESNKMFPVSYSYYNTFSPVIGLTYRDSIYKWLRIKTAAYYVQRGVRFDYTFNIPNFYYLHSVSRFTGHYISCPIRLYAQFKGFFFGAGVEASYLMKAHYYVQMTEKQPPINYEQVSTIDKWYGEQWFQQVDAGYTFNFGYAKNNWEIEASIFHGLVAPPKFDYFSYQHFEYKYKFQETFAITFNYYPNLKRNKNTLKK